MPKPLTHFGGVAGDARELADHETFDRRFGGLIMVPTPVESRVRYWAEQPKPSAALITFWTSATLTTPS